MKSEIPKGLHRIAGLPMVELVGRAMKAAGVARPVVVVGHGGEALIEALGDGYDYVWQREQLGTGHAALMAEAVLSKFDGPVLIAPGDAPLLDADLFRALVAEHMEAHAVCSLLTSVLADPSGYGRVVRDSQGNPSGIVEHKDANESELSIREVNAGVYCIQSADLFRILPTLGNSNRQGEYYLTDIVSKVAESGGKVLAVRSQDSGALVGVNDRWQLAQAESAFFTKILKRHALAGVTLIGHESIRIEPDVEISRDVVIEGPAQVKGNSKILAGARVGPSSRIIDSTIGERTVILMSHIASSSIGTDAWVGPFANIRPGCEIGDRVRIGNFVEINRSQISPEAKVPHLSYVGDASIGVSSNVGAGVITANYDGFSKHATVVGDRAFVGSNSTLIAPITIGDGAFVVAGSVITEDVPADAGAFGRARQATKPEWAAKYRRRKKSTTP